MNKIGILTFHASHNCGSMLQAFALQQKLLDMGYDNEIIDFANIGSERLYGVMPHVHLEKGLKGSGLLLWLRSLPYISLIKGYRQSFLNFSDANLIKSLRSYHSASELKHLEKYDIYITGSDQVWNVACGDADDTYFLNFVKEEKKIAYAVSFGGTRLMEKVKESNKYQKYLSSFAAISVREKSAIKQVESLGRNDAILTLDPTMLLTEMEWLSKINIGDPIINGDYIFYYAFNYRHDINKVVCQIGKKYNMPVYIVDAKAWGPKRARNDGIHLSSEYGPIAFLNLVKNATLCLTTSFHGTVFSILFGKRFWFIESSMHCSFDDRASSLTELVGLQSRHINMNNILNCDLLAPVDYHPVYDKLNKEREKSLSFLKSSLE